MHLSFCFHLCASVSSALSVFTLLVTPFHDSKLRMKYTQIPLSRLSRAGKLFVSDGQWHRSVNDDALYYRVQGKMVQRIRLEVGETVALLPLFAGFTPLPSKALREGFREELRFRIEDDAYVLSDNYTRGFIGWNRFAHIAEKKGITTTVAEGNLLRYSVRIADWTSTEILRSIIRAKVFALIATRIGEDSKLGIEHSDKEVTGMFTAAEELLAEELGLSEPELPVKKNSPPQISLFGDSPD